MSFFFFNDTATTEIYTLSLHDALPIYRPTRRPPSRGSGAGHQLHGRRRRRSLAQRHREVREVEPLVGAVGGDDLHPDRKSTRLNSSHANISYAVFCLKKQKPTYVSRSG